MARTLLTPTVIPALSGFNLTTATGVAPSATGTGNGVLFTNFPGQTMLLVINGATVSSGIVTAAIGATILGEPFAAVQLLATVAASSLFLLGPFYSSFDQVATNQVGVDFAGAITTVTCLALQLSGVV
jgi:hypothetical protein